MDTHEGLLQAVGFTPNPPQGEGASFANADAARRTSDVQQQLALARADTQMAGEEERSGINTDFEDRGMFKSGARGNELAQQQGREASKLAQLEAGAAADIGNIGSQMQRELAAERMQRESQAQEDQLFQLQFGAQQSQLSTAAQMQAEQIAATREQQRLDLELARTRLELLRQTAGS